MSMQGKWVRAVVKREVREGQEVTSVWWKIALGLGSGGVVVVVLAVVGGDDAG